MVIEKVKASEVERVGEIFKNCARHMNAKGLFNWTEAYPSVKEAGRDQQKGTLYGIYDGELLIGVITLDQSPAPEYAGVTWQVPQDQALCVHRVAVDPPYRRKGAASRLLKFADKEAMERGLKAIRIDSFSKNHRAVRLYVSRGYEMRGDIFYDHKDERVKGLPFHCLEKML